MRMLRLFLACLLAGTVSAFVPALPAEAHHTSCPGSITFNGGTPSGNVTSADGNVVLTANFTANGPGFTPQACDISYVDVCELYVDGAAQTASCTASPGGGPRNCSVSTCTITMTGSMQPTPGPHTVTAKLVVSWGCCLWHTGGTDTETATWSFNFKTNSACGDLSDNDGDGRTDFPNDPGCASTTDPSERGTVGCDDGTDNDLDGAADYPADAGCTGPTDEDEHRGTVCDNGVDDDFDGATDYPADGGCSSPTDSDEWRGTVCDNGADDDGDGWTDYPRDPGCSSPTDSSEVTECSPLVASVVFCVTPGSRVVLDEVVPAASVPPGATHAVRGYVDAYRFVVPGGGPVVVPCVVLVHDGTQANPCATAGGEFAGRTLTLLDNTYRDPDPTISGQLARVRVCEGEIKLMAFGFGSESFPGFATC